MRAAVTYPYLPYTPSLMNPLTAFNADCERLRTARTDDEFQTLRAHLVASLKKDFPVETGNPRLFYDNGANLIMPSSPLPTGLEAWLTAHVRPMPCGGNFGAQQIWEGSLEGRRERMSNALLSAARICHQEHIDRPMREKALEKKMAEWRDRMSHHVIHWFNMPLTRFRAPSILNKREAQRAAQRALADAMRTAFYRDRDTYREMARPPRSPGDYDDECPITTIILEFGAEQEGRLGEELKKAQKRKKQEQQDRRTVDLLARAIREASNSLHDTTER